MLRPFKEHAPAKLNLFLHILGKRPDGYHDIESLMLFCNFGDWVSLTPAPVTSLKMSGPFATAIEGENLLLKTLEMLNHCTGRTDHFTLHLEKNIPVGAGLGGGSADAAALIRAYQKVQGIELNGQDIHALSVKLGADVYPCVFSQSLIARGTGDRLEFLALELPYVLLLIKPKESLSAGEVYAAGPTISEPLRDLMSIDLGLLKNTRNDLTLPAAKLVPHLEGLIAELSASKGCVLARLSGSGTVCFGLFEDQEDAQNASRTFESQGCWTSVTTQRSS